MTCSYGVACLCHGVVVSISRYKILKTIFSTKLQKTLCFEFVFVITDDRSLELTQVALSKHRFSMLYHKGFYTEIRTGLPRLIGIVDLFV